MKRGSYKKRQRDEYKYFYSRVKKTSDCWIYEGYVNVDGYGRHFSNGNYYQAHRFALLLEGLDIPSGLFACHSCDNRACVNPDHQFLGTQLDNMQDCKNKKRSNNGEKNGRSKLTEIEVSQIRTEFSTTDINQLQLAKKYRIDPSMISYIVRRKNWIHI